MPRRVSDPSRGSAGERIAQKTKRPLQRFCRNGRCQAIEAIDAIAMIRETRLEMLGEEAQRAAVREHRRVLVVRRAHRAVEAVIGARVDIDVGVVAAREALLHLADLIERNAVIEFAVVEQDRLLDLVGEIELRVNAAAVVRHRRVDRTAARRHIGETAAEAVADGRDLARALGQLAQRVGGCRDVLYDEIEVGGFHQLDAAVAVGARVFEFDARGAAPEDVRRDRDVTVERILLDHVTDMAVHAEDLLDDDDAGTLAAFGQGEIGAETVLAGGNVDPSSRYAHVALLLREWVCGLGR
ncbi:hypothetical protein PT2222_10242 [Paraburkholderia tropica]